MQDIASAASVDSATSTEHLACLEKLCRVCGTILTQRVTYQCERFCTRLWAALKVNTDKDDPEVHPPKMCNNCYRQMTRTEQKSTEGKGEKHLTSLKIVHWERHSNKDCATCDMYGQKSRGGRPKKKAKERRSSEDGIRSAELIQHMSSFEGQLQQLRAQQPLQVIRFSLPPFPIRLEDFICPKCRTIVDQPVETVCGHMLCYTCTSNTMEEHSWETMYTSAAR